MDFFDFHLREYGNTNPGNMFLEKEVENVLLPSLGFFYTGKYKNIKELPVRKLNTLDELILCTESLHKSNKVLIKLLQNVIEDKEFPVEDLTIVDRDTILYWLRIGAYGSKADMSFPCSNEDCDNKVKMTWDFGLLQFPDYPIEYLEFLKDNDCLKTIINDVEYHLVPPTIKKEIEVDNFIKNDLNKTPEEMLKTRLLLIGIKQVTFNNNNYSTISKIYNYLISNSISLNDSKEIQKYLNDISLKITLKQKAVCNKCENSITLTLPPVSNNFFGFDKPKHKEYLDEIINYLVFWGRLDYSAALHLPSYKRKKWAERTNENIKLLYGSK